MKKVIRNQSAYQIAKAMGCSTTIIYNWTKNGLPHDIVRKGLRDIKQYNYDEVLSWYQDLKSRR